MNNLFSRNCLSVVVNKNSDESVTVDINSDYLYSERKSQLFVNSKDLVNRMEQEWVKLKEITRKITKFSVHFEEIDWYDDECDMYQTPVIILAKGKSKAIIASHSHGFIPKDWSVNISVRFEGVKQKKVILESIKCILGNFYSQEIEKALEKTNEVLNGKQKYIYYENE